MMRITNVIQTPLKIKCLSSFIHCYSAIGNQHTSIFLKKFRPSIFNGEIHKDRAPSSSACCNGPVFHLPIMRFLVCCRV